MNNCSSSTINLDTMIPHLLTMHPESRPVLDKLGLRGCGGPLGPYETLGYFARAHGIDESKLLSEIDAAIQQQDPKFVEEAPAPGIADTIYRPFFTGGIITILTFGATWGALLLWRISMNTSFHATPAMEINAHAQAQVYGWMGFFIMGFAYQAFPRFWQTNLVKPEVALIVFSLLFTGVFLSSVTMPFCGCGEWPAALASCAALSELAAVMLFAGHLYLTFRSSARKCEPYIAFVFTALIWFILSSILNLYVTFGLMTDAGASQSFYLDICQPILRDLQFHGMGLTLILGVSLRTLPGLFGLPGISAPRAVAGLTLLTAGVSGEVGGLALWKMTGLPSCQSVITMSHVAILLACLFIVAPFKLWRPFPETGRANKFIRAAFLWLFISLFMLVGAPLYARISGIPASHAYLGAIRHAITVGFISLMIMGYSSKVVPTLNGINPDSLNGLYLPFYLVNCGCAMRVILQTGTDWSKACYAAIGVSGTLEVLGMALWGLHLLRAGLIANVYSIPVSRPPRPAEITADCIVSHVLDWYPQTEAIFISNGFTGIKNPMMRKTLANQISIGLACRMQQVDARRFIDALNAEIQTQALTEQQNNGIS